MQYFKICKPAKCVIIANQIPALSVARRLTQLVGLVISGDVVSDLSVARSQLRGWLVSGEVASGPSLSLFCYFFSRASLCRGELWCRTLERTSSGRRLKTNVDGNHRCEHLCTNTLTLY